MDELPLAIQEKLRGLPGAESGLQVVEVILEDGRIVPDVTVVGCAYVEQAGFEPEQVADVRLPAAPPSGRKAVVFLLLLLLGIFVMFYLLWQLKPQ
ncbi:MAG: hypothetical protein HY656_03255 [Acidobacteria bacterium]|nr:hypothetical protein [Acidobacteriota bacterium]